VVAFLFRNSFPRVTTYSGWTFLSQKAVVKYLPYTNKGVLVVYKGLYIVGGLSSAKRP